MGACGFTVALADHGALSEARAMPDAITEPSLTLVLNRTAFTAYNATTVRALVEFGLDPSDAGAQLGALQGRPFEAEYTRLVPLSGGTAVPEKTVPPQISTGTAAYVVTTNGRRVGYAWIRFQLWYA
jgi:hypothetical protein